MQNLFVLLPECNANKYCIHYNQKGITMSFTFRTKYFYKKMWAQLITLHQVLINLYLKLCQLHCTQDLSFCKNWLHTVYVNIRWHFVSIRYETLSISVPCVCYVHVSSNADTASTAWVSTALQDHIISTMWPCIKSNWAWFYSHHYYVP